MTTYHKSRRLDAERSVAVIDALGGTMKVAREFGIRHPSVTNRLQFIQLKYRRIPEVKATLDFHPWTDR